MSLNFDTETIRRLRDALLAGSRAESTSSPGDAESASDRLQASMERAAPFVETMYLVMIADGQVERAEKQAIMGAISLLTHGLLQQSALDSILAASAGEVERHGVEARLQMIGAKISADRQDREIAFTLAAAVAMADEQLALQEGSLLESIAEWYGISHKRCNEILQQL
ncbi:MAG: TerB family tellurite resistance protein [Gammaproteobacteria bacterium]|jgi:tellurite resistance protein